VQFSDITGASLRSLVSQVTFARLIMPLREDCVPPLSDHHDRIFSRVGDKHE
jgi:hypothetical protein